MADQPELGSEVRFLPLRGMDHSGKPAVVMPGYSWYEENFFHDRRSARKRPARRRLNVHAAGRAGWRCPQNAMGVSGASALHHFGTNVTFEGWITPSNLVNTGAVTNVLGVFWKGPMLNFNSGISMTFVLGMGVPVIGTADWLVRVQERNTGTVRVARGGVPKNGKRTHLAWVYDSVNALLRLIVDGVEVNSVAMNNPPVDSDYPVMCNEPGDVVQPGFKYEDWRAWLTAKTAADIAAAKDDEVDPTSANLAWNWQGTKGGEWEIEDRGGHNLPLFFLPAYPYRRAGIQARSMNFPGVDLAGAGCRATLELTDTTQRSVAAFQGNLNPAATGINWGLQIAGIFHGFFEFHATASRIADGLCRVEILPSKVVRVTPSDDAAAAITGVITLRTGVRQVIGVRRAGAVLQLYVNGVLDGASVPQNAIAQVAADQEVGSAVTSGGLPGCWECEEITFYGTDPGTTVFTTHDDVPLPDRIKLGGTGNAIQALTTFGVTVGSPTVTYSGAQAADAGKFLLFKNETTGRWDAYRITAVAVGVSYTIDINWPGRTNPTQWGALSTVLYHNVFTHLWDPQSDNDASLQDLVEDELQILSRIRLDTGISVRQSQCKRVTGYVRSRAIPCVGIRRYEKEGEMVTALAVFDRTLYMADDRWRSRDTGAWQAPAGVGRYSVLVLPNDHWGRPAAGSSGPPEFGQGAKFGYSADLYPFTVRGKHVLYAAGDRQATGQTQGLRLLLYIEDGYLKAEWQWDNGGVTNLCTLVSNHAVIKAKEWVRIEAALTQNTTAGSQEQFRVNGSILTATLTNKPPGNETPVGTCAETDRSLFGLRPDVQDDLIAEGFSSFLGLVKQVRLGTEPPFSVSFVQDLGTLDNITGTTCLLLLESGRGWVYDDTGQSDGIQICNLSRLLYPVLENIPLGDADAPYSLRLRRGILYGCNGRGRHIKAEWSGDFDAYPTGWKSGFSGIAPPRHKPTLVDTGVASTIMSAGKFQVAYAYLDTTTGRRSNPSAVVEITTPGATRIRLDGIQPSADPTVDAIEVYMTAASQAYRGKILEVANAMQSVTLDFSAETIRAGLELEFTHELPPPARHLRFDLGRAYWGNLDFDLTSKQGQEGSGAVAFSNADEEESWDPLNILKVDPNAWRPVTGFGGQQGVVHVYTENAIYRLVPGIGDITSFALRVATTRIGTIDGSSIVEYMGVEMAADRDGGLFLFNGQEAIPTGRELERLWLRNDEDATLGIRAQPLMGAVYDARHRSYLWAYQRDADSRIARGVALSRRLGEADGGYSDLDFWDISAQAEHEDAIGWELVLQADSWGYLYQLAGTYQDTDWLGNTREDGQGRAQNGIWNTTPIRGPLVGDGARGYTLVAYDTASDLLTNITYTRLLKTPAGATPTSAELEIALSFAATNGTTLWILGPVRQVWRSPWLPMGATEITQDYRFLDLAFEPSAGEKLWIRWYTADANGRTLDSSWTASKAKERAVPMDDGLTQGEVLEKDRAGKRLIFELEYLGTRQLELHEAVLRMEAEGGEYGPANT